MRGSTVHTAMPNPSRRYLLSTPLQVCSREDGVEARFLYEVCILTTRLLLLDSSVRSSVLNLGHDPSSSPLSLPLWHLSGWLMQLATMSIAIFTGSPTTMFSPGVLVDLY